MNQLVAMCSDPWDVDTNLGACGVCYFGNLGEKPPSVLERMKLLLSNRRELRNQ
jgi:hypothetical protein